MKIKFGQLVIGYLLIIKEFGDFINLLVFFHWQYFWHWRSYWNLLARIQNIYFWAWNNIILIWLLLSPISFVRSMALSFGSLLPSSKYNISSKRFVCGLFELFAFRLGQLSSTYFQFWQSSVKLVTHTWLTMK